MNPEEAKRLRELVERQSAIRAALLELEEKETPTDEEIQTQEDLLTEFETNEPERDDLQKKKESADSVRRDRMEAIIKLSHEQVNREQSVWTSANNVGGLTLGHHHRDPYQELELVRSGLIPRSEVKARAYAAIERSAANHEFGHEGDHDRAELATRRVEESYGCMDKGSSNDVASHILLTGHPDYQTAFRAYLENPEQNRFNLDAVRTALSLTSTAGGFLLPYVLDPTIVLTNSSSANPYRRISANKTTTSNAWQGVNSAGVTAAWLAEGTASADASPAVGQIQITPKKGSAWIFGSYEVLADTDFANQLPGLLADARDRLEETAFTTGNGTTAPKGIVTAATTLVNTATTLVYAIADVYATQAALPARFRASASAGWVMNVAYINKTRAFDVAGGSSFWTNLGKGQPETLLGAPIYESTTMFGTTQGVGSKIAVFGDWSKYYIVDRVGTSIIYEPLVKDQTTTFPTGQGGWFMFWRTGADVATVNAFRVLNGL